MNIRLKKLIYQCNHRGTKELDILLGGFASACGRSLSEAEVQDIEHLLSFEEPLISGWLVEGMDLPLNLQNPGVDKLLDYIKSHHSLIHT